MKHLKFLFPVILPVFFLTACSGNNSTEATKNKDSSSNSSAINSSGNEAYFSCIIDGQPVSGGQINTYQGPEGYQSNEAHIVDVDQGKQLLIYLSDPEIANTQGVHSLRLAVPDKTGSSSFGPDENGWGIEVDIQPNKDHEARYFSDSFTLNVTKISLTSASGTFSGKFKLNGNITDTDKKEIEVTDGKFDVPMRK